MAVEVGSLDQDLLLERLSVRVQAIPHRIVRGGDDLSRQQVCVGSLSGAQHTLNKTSDYSIFPMLDHGFIECS